MMKKVGIGFGILFLLLIGSALVVPGFINWNEYKFQIEQTASDLSGRDVAINGDLSLSILPSPSFSAQNVSVSNIEGGQAEHFISLKSVDVNVAFFPLLRGQIQVKKFILVEPVVAIEIDEDGLGNWVFGSPEEKSEEQGLSAELSFEQFQIENGQISFQDFNGGTLETVRMINASVTMDSLQGPFEINGSARYKNLPISTELMLGTIREGRKVPVNVVVGLIEDTVGVKFSGALLLDADNPELDGKINLEARDISDVILAISLLDIKNTNQNNKTYNQPLSLESNVSYSDDTIHVEGLEFELGESRGSGKLTATLGDKINFDGDIAINSFNLDSILPHLNQEESTGDNQSPDLAFLNEFDGTFNLKLGALRFNDKIASQLDLNLNIQGGALNLNKVQINMPGGSELSLDGQLSEVGGSAEFNGNIILTSGNLRAFLNWLKIDTSSVPNGRLTRLSYKGGIKADQDLLQLYEIEGALDTISFNGGLSYALQDRPAYGLDFTIEDLNIDNYLAPGTDEPANLREQVGILGEFDANYKINLRNLTTQGIKVKNINLSGDLFDGNLNIRTLKIDDYAGFDLNGTVIGRTLGDKPEFDITFNTIATSLLPLQRAYRFKTGFDISHVGALALSANLKGDFEKLSVDIKSTLGISKADVKGEIRSATLKQLPEIGSVDLIINASNPSFISLIDQFNLPLARARATDDRMIGLKTTLKGNQQLIDIDSVINVAGGQVSLKGRTNFEENKISSFDLVSDISGPDVRQFIRGLGIGFKPSKNDLGSLQIKTTLSGTVQNIAFNNIVGNIGPTKLTGSGEIKGLSQGEETSIKPSFDFTLTLDDIPVQDFMEESAKEEDWGNWTKEPMELEILDQYDGRALITANNINYNEYHFENPRFEAVLKDGVININGFSGKLFGGDVAIAGSLSSKGDLNGDMSLKNASVTLATTSVAGIKPISGTFDMTQKFKAKGTSQSALISSLSGTGEIKASPGVISGIDIPELSERLKGLDNKNGLLSLLSSTLSGGETPYQGGQSTITTKDGNISLSPLDVKMQGAQSTINMDIDLARWNMNMNGNMALDEHPEAPPIGISVLGALHDPDIKYNTKELEGFIAAKIAANLLQNMVDGGGGLGQLFGNTPPQPTPVPPGQEQEPTKNEAVPEEKPETIEDLGIKLLDRLFQKPPP